MFIQDRRLLGCNLSWPHAWWYTFVGWKMTGSGFVEMQELEMLVCIKGHCDHIPVCAKPKCKDMFIQ